MTGSKRHLCAVLSRFSFTVFFLNLDIWPLSPPQKNSCSDHLRVYPNSSWERHQDRSRQNQGYEGVADETNIRRPLTSSVNRAFSTTAKNVCSSKFVPSRYIPSVTALINLGLSRQGLGRAGSIQKFHKPLYVIESIFLPVVFFFFVQK